jgi:hypothetical protein
MMQNGAWKASPSAVVTVQRVVSRSKAADITRASVMSQSQPIRDMADVTEDVGLSGKALRPHHSCWSSSEKEYEYSRLSTSQRAPG